PLGAKESRFSKSFSKSNRSPDILDDWTLYTEGDSSEDDFYGRAKSSNPSASLSTASKSHSEYSAPQWPEKKPAPKKTTYAPANNYTAPSTAPGDTQKKFGSAKSISSSQYFGDTGSQDTKSDMSRFEGSSSISSADYFGQDSPYGSTAYGGGPDLDDVRESVRQGVTKVAGKLSSLANGVMSSIQEKYGGY
ncbi:ADP-ribosylation factor GTPase-activating protein 3-like, partial [Diaphorina citri]|uniref:ADP-ribosylation factor GTPase-activating protein 3-like n=1 Tax=Diaphorina citri TaxID=121845 RepID=A0A3Q0JJ16_DIACI